MKLRFALLAAAIAVIPFAARTQVVAGPYISTGLGGTYEQNESGAGGGIPGNGKFNWGWAGQASGGYGYGNGWRIELEGNYLNNQLNAAPRADSAGGREEKYGAFANALFDFDPGWGSAFPYLGVGAGYQQVNESLRAGIGTDYYSLSGDKGNFAAQAIAGVAFPISGIPGLSLTAEYRLQDALGNRRYGATEATPAAFSDYSASAGSAYNHSLLLGLRYSFGAAPAPLPVPPAPPAPAAAPAAAPAPARARTYLVFFDWDKADLSDKAKSVIADAAQAATQVQTTQIGVNGYTDLSGTASYNQGLSIRRAQAVADELVRLGVPDNEIEISGFGETKPLIPTAPGVREPQNRRVEIIVN